MLLSRLERNLPNILIASTRNPPLSSMLMIVSTHSYRMAFPAFLFDSVLVATQEKYSNYKSQVAIHQHQYYRQHGQNHEYLKTPNRTQQKEKEKPGNATNLSKYVIHAVTGICISLSQHTQQLKQSDVEKRICNASNIILRCIGTVYNIPQSFNQTIQALRL